ncbi:MAG TPA: transposase [Ohtaekwangia sp.]|nr:transposase [Ohtaekwangia sp.]
MSEKFKGKYRSDSARLRNWDYGSDGAYFITICTHNREHFFGEINNNKMNMSPAGAIAHVLWDQIKNHAKNVELGEFVVMPNHVHGILILNGNNVANDFRFGRDVACNVPTETEKTNPKNHQMAAISPKPNTISTIIRSYKSSVTRYCNQLGLQFAWQSRFHDHIIRSDESFNRISEYIKNNPANWKEARFQGREDT